MSPSPRPPLALAILERRAREGDGATRSDPARAKQPDTLRVGLPPHTLHCRSCGNELGSAADLFEFEPGVPLVFANPHGLVFELLLLRAARGLVVVGGSTLEHTWFGGYAWQALHCSGCLQHMGWRYTTEVPREIPTFFGLLRAEVVERGAPD